MNHPRWKKIRGDLRVNRGRVVMMVIALAAGIFGLTAMLTAYTILTREISRNYLSTNPASATLELDRVDPALVDQARVFPGIADAEARGAVLSRVRVGNDWMPILLFVIDDFGHMHLNRFLPETGAWPPPTGTLLLERSAVEMLHAPIGTALLVRTPHGQPREVSVSGLVHDTGLAPSWQERTGYAYITRETLALLGEAPVLEELRIKVAGDAPTVATIQATARKLAESLTAQGNHVQEIQVPPPRRHPHQGQMEGVLTLFIVFSALTLVLSAIMVATVVAGILAGQVRQIGIMKAIGARARQIALLYGTMLLALGAVSVLLGVPAGVLVGHQFADMISAMLNFTLASYAVPSWVFALVVTAGLTLPVAMAAFPILRSSRITVRAALNDYGVSVGGFGQQRLERAVTSFRGMNRVRSLALRNLLRRRGRLVLSLGLLAASGGLFMTGLNLKEGWRHMIGRVYADRFYDVEIRLNRPESEHALRDALRQVPGIRAVEAWGYMSTAVAEAGSVDVAHTYPDGGHGSFTLLGTPHATQMVKFPLSAGRWLAAGDTDAVVLNQMAAALVPGVKLGDQIQLSVDGRPVPWRVVGFIVEVGSPAGAYVPAEAYARVAGTTGQAQMLRIASSAKNPEARIEMIRQIEQALTASGVSVHMGLPLAELQTAIGDHIAVLIGTLVVAASLIGLIGVLGLTSSMSMNVIERTREFGVIKAVGGRPKTILAMVVQEGVFVGFASWFVAVPLGLGLSLVVGRIVGMMAFKVPLALVPSYSGQTAWLVAVLVLSALASLVPAWRASRLTVREALAYA